MVIILTIQKKEILEQPGEGDKPSPGIRLCDDALGTLPGARSEGRHSLYIRIRAFLCGALRPLIIAPEPQKKEQRAEQEERQ